MNQDRHVRSFIVEFAAIVFLAITLPFWLPILLSVGMLALKVGVVLIAIIFLLAMCSRSEANFELNYLTSLLTGI